MKNRSAPLLQPPARKIITGLGTSLGMFCLMTLTTVPAQAADNYWTGSLGLQDWKYTANWSLGDVPDNGQDVFLINAGLVELNMAASPAVVPQNGALQSLLIDGGSTLRHAESNASLTTGVLYIGSGTFQNSQYILGNGNLTVYGFTVIGGKDNRVYDPITWQLIEDKSTYGTGTFSQNSGSSFNTGGLYLGDTVGSIGTYNLYDGNLAVSSPYAVLGANGGTGIFNQSGGTFAANNLEVGGSGFGTYTLSGGNLNAANNTFIGAWGVGTFNQDGGAHLTGTLEVGSHGTGTYNLNAGNLNSGSTIVGNFGTGTFNQYGGTHSTGTKLLVDNEGKYQLSDGNLIGFEEHIGATGNGYFTQTGGTNSMDTLALGYTADGTGSYDLGTNGSITAGVERIGLEGTGIFKQTGGINTISDTLVLGQEGSAKGFYTLEGGTLAANFVQIGGAGNGTFTHKGGTLNAVGFTDNEINLGQGSDSLGIYNLSSLGVLNVGRNLNIGIEGTGVFTQSGSSQVKVTEGVVLSTDTSGTGVGTYNLQGGSLSSGYTNVGAQGGGTFNQTGGLHSTFDLLIGDSVNSSGSYSLSGSSSQLLVTNNETVGDSGTGIFTQTGGNHTVNRMILGGNLAGEGTYELNAGTLNANAENVGYKGTGTFTQTEGTNTVANNLNVGYEASATGTYNLTTGTLRVGTGTGPNINSQVGVWGTGTFNQGGGTHEVGGTLFIGKYSGSSGTYNLTDGTLNVVGANGIVNNDKFNYSGGTLNADITNNAPGTVSLGGSGTRVVGGVVTNAGSVNVNSTMANFTNNVTNTGTFKITDSTVNFTDTFTNSGAYISDPSTNYFHDLIIDPSGYLVGGVGDEFIISGDFWNNSLSSSWNTDDSDLFFTGSGFHTFQVGPSQSFEWHTLHLLGEAKLILTGGAVLHLEDLAGLTLASISGVGTIVYDVGGTNGGSGRYEIGGGTSNGPVPEPATMILFGTGIAGLAALRRRKKAC